MDANALAKLISGQAADGSQALSFSTDSWPPSLNIPPEGVKLKRLRDFINTILGGAGMGYAGTIGALDDFVAKVSQDVYLTRFDVDLENPGGQIPFFIGFQLRESWEIISDSGLPITSALALNDPGFTIGSPVAGAGYLVDIFGTFELFGAALQVMVQWPAMIVTGTLVRPLNLQ